MLLKTFALSVKVYLPFLITYLWSTLSRQNTEDNFVIGEK